MTYKVVLYHPLPMVFLCFLEEVPEFPSREASFIDLLYSSVITHDVVNEAYYAILWSYNSANLGLFDFIWQLHPSYRAVIAQPLYFLR